jgi:hypothetical protein
VQPNGSLAQRSGVRFLDKPKGIDVLLKMFDIESGEEREEGSAAPARIEDSP